MRALVATAALLAVIGLVSAARAQDDGHHHHHHHHHQDDADAGVDAAVGDASTDDAAVPAADPAAAAADPAAAPTDAAAPSPDASSADPPSPDAQPSALTSLPREQGLPIPVHVGVAVLDLASVDENEGAFDATFDLRVTWSDPRLAYPAAEAPGGPRTVRDAEADARLAEIWQPDIRIANLDGDFAHRSVGLRIAPNGRVELLQRLTGRFHTAFDVTRFPFDRQRLALEILSEGAPRDLVSLVVRQEDLDFTTVAEGVEADGWSAVLVDLRREQVRGWHGDRHDRVRASLVVQRDPGTTAAPIFIPLIASLLIPLLAMWLNRYDEGEFKIEAFELANVIVGGLFAVIALNFTVMSELSTLGVGDNTVSRLFALNYLTLAVSLLVNLGVFRYRVIGRWLGPHVEAEAFSFLTWAIPVLAFGSALAFVLAAYA